MGRENRFVVLEGLDGAGTTTQAQRLTRALKACGLKVCATAEPSEGPLGRLARAHVRREIDLDPVAATLTFTADRADHLTRTIRPALAAGGWVVCDRYLLSTLAYQGASGVDASWVMELSRGFDAPVTFYLDVPEAQAQQRLADRPGRDRYEDATLSAAIRDGYLHGIRLLRDAGQRVVVVDGTAPPAEVTDALVSQIL